MKVLILSVKAGYGHHSAAMAIIDEFEKHGHECYMLDMFEYVNEHLGNSIQGGYLLSTKYLSTPYGKVYGKLNEKEEPYDRFSALSMASKLIAKKLVGFTEEYLPDLIIGTHSFACMVMTDLRDNEKVHCPTIGVVTDFTIHPFWESTVLDYYVTADELLTYSMMKKGIPEQKVLPFGIPIRDKFSQKTEKKEARRLLGIENKTTFLVMSGSMGYGNMKKNIIEMDNFPVDFLILCVCGSNKRTKSTLNKYEWKKDVRIYGFVDNIDLMMDAADFIISKPGGLTTSEAFAKNLPMITVNPLTGQEDRNADFLVNCGAVIMVNKRFSISEAIYQVLKSPVRVELMKKSVERIGKPFAAQNLYRFVCDNVIKSHDGNENSLPLK